MVAWTTRVATLFCHAVVLITHIAVGDYPAMVYTYMAVVARADSDAAEAHDDKQERRLPGVL
jgi:ribosomal protein S12